MPENDRDNIENLDDLYEWLREVIFGRKLSNLLGQLQEIIDGLEEASELREKLEDLQDRIRQNEPTSLLVARCLAEILGLFADELPAHLGDWIKAYLDAFKDAIDAILGVMWGRYKRYRETGSSHEEALELINPINDEEISLWLQMRWWLSQQPEPEPEPELEPEEENEPTPEPEPANTPSSGPATPGPAPITPPPRPTQPTESAEARRIRECCSIHGHEGPTIDVSGLRVEFDQNGYVVVNGEAIASHPCGIRKFEETTYLISGNRHLEVNSRNTEGTSNRARSYSYEFRYEIVRGTAYVMFEAVSMCGSTLRMFVSPYGTGSTRPF